MNRFRHFGLQRRIMLYVTAGLAVMFGVLAFLGLGAIDQATQLVFRERLTTAYTTAAILAHDFADIANEARVNAQELGMVHGEVVSAGATEQLLEHFNRIAPDPFFSVSGIWLVDAQGGLIGQAGNPVAPNAGSGVNVTAALASAPGDYAVLRAVGQVPGAIAFAAVAVRIGAPTDAGSPIAIVHTISENSPVDYVPALYGRPLPSPAASSPQGSATQGYHLEVVDPDGVAILGIGSDEQPGQQSHHYPVIRSLMAQGGAAAQIHEPGPGDTFAPHVMAVVPLPSSPFYVVLEQPVDVALALPLQLREQLLLTTGLGFLAALLFAWITTRRVVKPTEELTAAASRMAQGDLATPIDVSAQDELGRLAENLDLMRGRLRAAYEAIEHTNRELEQRVADRTARLDQLLRQTINAQEEERYRLARELHDETAQALAALTVALDRARDGLTDASAEVRDRIGEARRIAASLLAETRRLILGLRPALLDDMGLLPAIRSYGESTLGPLGVELTVEAQPPPPRLAGHIEVALFRIVQEAITNVAKHAQARRVTIHVSFEEGTVTVSIADDGTGFDVDRVLGQSEPDSVGLQGMLERVRLLNGRMEIRSAQGGGTTVLVQAPVIGEAG